MPSFPLDLLVFLNWLLYICVQGIEKMFIELFLQTAVLSTFKIWFSHLIKYIVGEVASFHVVIWDVFTILDPHCVIIMIIVDVNNIN